MSDLLKDCYKNRRIDFIFCMVFFILLIIPTIKFSKNTVDMTENRTLAVKPQKIDFEFPKKFDAWFNDHFNGRSFFVNMYQRIRQRMSWNILDSDITLLDKKDEITFDRRERSYWASRYKTNFLKLKDYVNGIKKFREFCAENKIKCFIEMVPNKGIFFNGGNIFNVLYPNRGLDFVNTIYENSGVKIIYPIDEMMEENKKDLIYFKTDHHWTDVGTFVGYKAFIKELKKDFPKIVPLSVKDFDVSYSNKVRAEIDRSFWKGYGCYVLRLSDKECPLNTKYKFYDYKFNDKVKVDWDTSNNQKTFSNPNAKNNQTVVIIGNSFTENFAPMLAGTFRKVHKFRSNNQNGDNLKFSRWAEKIKEIKPDILIILAQDLYIETHLKTLF